MTKSNRVLAIEVTHVNEKMQIVIGAAKDLGHNGFSILVCDIVRHGAKAFNVNENAIWEWIDKERNHPTTSIEELRPN